MKSPGCPAPTEPAAQQLPQSGMTFVVAGGQASEIEPDLLTSLSSELYMLATIRSYDGGDIAIDMVQATPEERSKRVFGPSWIDLGVCNFSPARPVEMDIISM